MSHKRTTIRNAVVTMLTGSTTAGSNVYANRMTRNWTSELPAILIYMLDETNVPRDVRSNQYIRTLQLLIEIRTQATTNVDTDIDDIALEVEDLIKADQSLTGNALAAILTSTEVTLDSESELETGVAVLTYEVKYIL